MCSIHRAGGDEAGPGADVGERARAFVFRAFLDYNAGINKKAPSGLSRANEALSRCNGHQTSPSAAGWRWDQRNQDLQVGGVRVFRSRRITWL
jgi:hypothetical protein